MCLFVGGGWGMVDWDWAMVCLKVTRPEKSLQISTLILLQIYTFFKS